MCDQTGGLAEYEQLGATVIGISVDSPFTQEAWAKANHIGITLVSDLNKETTKAYGVLFPYAGRHRRHQRPGGLCHRPGRGGQICRTDAPHPKDLPDFAAVKAALAK
jgi:peroxiredoxin